jgi:hypothetical protein
MKKTVILLILSLILTSCGNFARVEKEPAPILYDNIMISIVTDKAIVFPKMSDKDFLSTVSSQLNNFTKAEIVKQGSLKVTSVCEHRTLKIVQEVTGITANTVTDAQTGFILFQLFRGTVNSKTKDIIYINTTATIVDCESGKELGSYNYQSEGQNPIESLQTIAAYNVYYAYAHQRGLK